MDSGILKMIREQGVLLEKEIYDILESLQNDNAVKLVLEKIVQQSGQKMITKAIFHKHFHTINQIVQNLPSSDKSMVENVFVKLGFQLEIVKEKIVGEEPKKGAGYKVFYANTKTDKKLEVADFTGHFRSRYSQLQRILLQRADLNNLVSINKISGERQNLSIIGMVTEKRITKNKNLILTLEDLTGKIQTLVKSDRGEVFIRAMEAQLDDVIAVKASGNRDMAFAHEVYFPDAFIHDKKRFEEETDVAFISDIHCGSDRHLGKSFQKFLTWLQESKEAEKIRYLFIVGDTVDGVGIFPGQEYVLSMKSMAEQYRLLASYLKQVPKHITIFMCPGQHDAVRVAEPQPIISRQYAAPLYEIENLVLVTNPSFVKLAEKEKEFGVLMYHGASIHSFINEISELREMKAHRTPAKAVRHMLKRRHLAPTHSSAVYIPSIEKDPLVIDEVPDILCTGEVHRLDIETYNGILIITGSCWQSQTDFEEKVGNVPDPGKVPIFNLKTRELKIYDFLTEEDG